MTKEETQARERIAIVKLAITEIVEECEKVEMVQVKENGKVMGILDTFQVFSSMLSDTGTQVRAVTHVAKKNDCVQEVTDLLTEDLIKFSQRNKNG